MFHLQRKLEVWQELVSEGAVGMEQVRFDGAGRTIKPSGDGFQGKLVVVAQGKHGALARRLTVDGIPLAQELPTAERGQSRRSHHRTAHR